MNASLRELIARVLEPQAWRALGLCDTLAYKNRRTSSLRKADAALAAIEASGTHVDTREYEALTRAARAFLDHPGIASASATLRGRVEQAERMLAARPRDVSPTDKDHE